MNKILFTALLNASFIFSAQAACRSAQVRSTQGSQALVCQGPDQSTVTFCFDDGIMQAGDRSSQSQKAEAGKILVGQNIENLRLKFTAFGFEPGMYKVESQGPVTIGRKQYLLQGSIDQWGSHEMQYLNPAHSKVEASGKCALRPADPSLLSLQDAIRLRVWEVVEEKVKKVVDLNAVPDLFNQPILPEMLSYQAPLGLLKQILDRGADVQQSPAGAPIALVHNAAPMKGDNSAYRIEVYKLLLAKGARIDGRQKYRGTTAFLMESVKMLYNPDPLVVVKFLISQGANPNEVGDDGGNAFHFLNGNDKDGGTVKIAKLLLQLGVNPKHKNKAGQTALEQLRAEGREKYNPNLVKFLESL